MDIKSIKIPKQYDLSNQTWRQAAIKDYSKQLVKNASQRTSGMNIDMINSGVLKGQIPVKHYNKLIKSMEEIEEYNVYVGIPAKTAERSDQGINNAELLYIQSNGVSKPGAQTLIKDVMQSTNMKYKEARERVWKMWLKEHGSPAYRIPPRPVIEPALMHSKKQISNYMLLAVKSYLAGDVEGFENRLKKLGQFAANKVKRWFTDPENGWPPNADSTKLAWAKKHHIAVKNGASEIEKNPLIDTGDLRKSITYVVQFPKNNQLKKNLTENNNPEYQTIK